MATTKNHIRVITATALFDGHDVSINIIRRILRQSGAEVIHLGHNRSAWEVVKAAIEEDVQGIAISSYQGGHLEYFKYLIDLLKEYKATHIKIFGGGGGVIVPTERKELESYGVTRIFSPSDGASLGLDKMVAIMLKEMDFIHFDDNIANLTPVSPRDRYTIAKLISACEVFQTTGNATASAGINKKTYDTILKQLFHHKKMKKTPVLGVTGTGGSGKSSLTDELISRFLRDFSDKTIAVLSCDPSSRKSGGALLGDRIRMNAVSSDRVFMRSLATRQSGSELSPALPDAIQIIKSVGFDLMIVETPGIGQGDSRVVDLVDVTAYVMTSEYGSAFQLEKIDMLDYADLVVVNKYDKQGSEDAVRDIIQFLEQSRRFPELKSDKIPAFGTIASRFNDDGVTALYHSVLRQLTQKTGANLVSGFKIPDTNVSTSTSVLIPPDRRHYLSEIRDSIQHYHDTTRHQVDLIRKQWHLEAALQMVEKADVKDDNSQIASYLQSEIVKLTKEIDHDSSHLLDDWRDQKKQFQADTVVYHVRDKEIKAPATFKSQSGLIIPKVALPKYEDPGELYRWLREENLPGHFPFTAGVYPLKRKGEDPTRMFAGEGDPSRTNRRFKLLSADSDAKRLSTAFDAVTIFGRDPDLEPDVYGKVGTSGVSVCSVEDMKRLYDGFDLQDRKTSVSMTINGPAPIILAMFFNAAINQKTNEFIKENKRKPNPGEADGIRKDVLTHIRGTVQADILKEDQGQNSCIFSIDFALKMMGDIQAYFIKNNVRNFYSVSISGYHIAEAGANPITQLALTLANGFSYVEYFLARGMKIDTFAPNLSFFFSNGMDPEYTVLGRVARRIWAIAMKERYGASRRSCQLKYHIQTSGRSLHSRDIQFNDIRTTLQALCAINDNCNSLHTNSYDEAITTPSDESVRRALAIQMIINQEWGVEKNENQNQGSFLVEELTQLVEEAVLAEFNRISSRGGVLGAMETGYQRGKIQEESMTYEIGKHTGEIPIVGVNTFLDSTTNEEETMNLRLSRATEKEKQSQLRHLAAFKKANQKRSPKALEKLKQTVLEGGNVFEELMDTVNYCSLGQITNSLNEVGGQYRRNM